MEMWQLISWMVLHNLYRRPYDLIGPKCGVKMEKGQLSQQCCDCDMFVNKKHVLSFVNCHIDWNKNCNDKLSNFVFITSE